VRDATSDSVLFFHYSGHWPHIRVRRFGTAITSQNAVLIAGCLSDQYSADAWIDNDYHGALTYSLYNAMRDRRFSLSYIGLVRETGSWLEDNNYEQIPQLESRENRKRWAFLGQQEYATSIATTTTSEAQSVGETFGPAAKTQEVFVHGIGDHTPGYSEEWRRAFNRYLALPLDNFHEAVWDDVFDERQRALRNLPEPANLQKKEEEASIKAATEIRALFEARQGMVEDIICLDEGERGVTAMDRVEDRGFFNWLLNFDEYIGDFMKYLASSKIRNQVNNWLKDRLAPLLQSGYPVALITHS